MLRKQKKKKNYTALNQDIMRVGDHRLLPPIAQHIGNNHIEML